MTFIDCAGGAGLAYTMVILEFLKCHYRPVDGKAYFDTLFGSTKTAAPEARRLVISQVRHLSTAQFLKDPLSSMNPNSYFFRLPNFHHQGLLTREKLNEMKHKSSQGNRNMPIGTWVCFKNHSEFAHYLLM